MPDDLLIARNPDPSSSLPYLVRIPLGPRGIVVKTRETWPRTTKVYCHRADGWPDDPEVVEQLPVRSISKRGAAIDLVVDRARENRSQFVITMARGREVIFWQTRKTAKQARPGVTPPTARAHGQVLEISVDSGEKYPYSFTRQQASTVRRKLPAGDYAVFVDDRPVAVAERKTIADLLSSLLSGTLTYVLAELATAHRAAVVVEEPYSRLFRQEHVAASTAAEVVAEAQARFPQVPIVFCDNRQMAQEWLYRWFGACLHEARLADRTDPTLSALAVAADPAPAEIRAWAVRQGIDVPARGRIPAAVRAAWAARND